MENMSYKYSADTASLAESDGSSCFTSYIEKDIEAYRWAFDPINDMKNFIPQAKDPDNNTSRRRCSGWALSFHATEDACKELWELLISNRPNKYKKIGTHIAKGSILKSDGKCSEIDKNSHFNLIEYESVDLKNKFTITKKLV